MRLFERHWPEDYEPPEYSLVEEIQETVVRVNPEVS